MTKCLNCKWNGESFNQLRRLRFLGFTHFCIEKSEKLDKSVIPTLITLDSHYELCIPSLISACWKILKKPENSEVLSYLYDVCDDKNYIRASKIMAKELEGKWNGSTFIELKGRNYSGFADFFMMSVLSSRKRSVSNDDNFYSRKRSVIHLIKIDEEYGTSFDETISASWPYLAKHEGLLLSLVEDSDTVYARATKILYRNFYREWDGQTYEMLRSYSNEFGYTSEYLWLSSPTNYYKFSSSVDLSDVEKLARLDLKKGTTIPELVHTCCFRFPKRKAIEKMIEIGKDILVLSQLSRESEKELAENIFNFRNQNGFSCLITLFDCAARYVYEHNNYPDNLPMMREIEESFFFLIEYAESNNIDMKIILNATTKGGQTLFYKASIYSESIAEYLLNFGVNVNSVDYTFRTPIIRVRFNLYTEKQFLVSRFATKNDRPWCQSLYCRLQWTNSIRTQSYSILFYLIGSSILEIHFLFY